MKLLVLYKAVSEHATSTETYIHDFQKQNPDVKIEISDPNSAQGAARAAAYGIVEYPALIAAQDDGAAHCIWQGSRLPLMSDIAGYMYI